MSTYTMQIDDDVLNEKISEILNLGAEQRAGEPILEHRRTYDTAFGCGLFKCNHILAKRLAAYEDAEEQGRLVRLPCKVGDTVYEVVKKRVDLTGYRMECGWETVVEAVKFRIGMTDSVGKTVFLTREEAEAVLKGEKE